MAAGGTDTFDFLNRAHTFPEGEVDWRSAEMEKLWRYNLHYFDYLLDRDRPFGNSAALISDWIVKNPPGTPDAWEPFPVSLRIVNWIRFFLRPEVRNRVEPAWRESLNKQLAWLERNVERHLLGNHYFRNGKALAFGGLYFEGNDGERWLRTGLRILSGESREQVLPDGGHFERSPMYHAMILTDILDLANLFAARERPDLCAASERLRETARSMLSFLLGMTHPDGRIALFNDAAFGIEAETEELNAYYERVTGEIPSQPGGKAWSFPASGYFVMAPRAGDRLFIDCGPVGPDYQPGHSHCDTLSFELSLLGRRVVVDSGCAGYPDGEIRRYNRGNAGHNTVTIDGKNQSEVWGSHRCARRAYPLHARLAERADASLHFEGAHDGYRRLPGAPTHTRAVSWSGNRIAIDDTVDGVGRHRIESRLHVHPDLAVRPVDGNAVLLAGDTPVASISAVGGGRIEQEEGRYCPEFGKILSCPVLFVDVADAKLPFRGGWRIESLQDSPRLHTPATSP